MRIHFFTAPFWLLSFGSGFKVQGSRGGFAAFFRRWYSRIVAFPDGEGLVVGIVAIRGKRISNIRGGANPVSLRSTAPSRGGGENVGRFECIYSSFLWKEMPAGRRLGAQSGVKDDVRLSIFLGKR